MSAKPKFIPWLFDSREAFEKTINDSRYRYQMTFNQFMDLYNEHRLGSKVSGFKFNPNIQKNPVAKIDKTSGHSQILTQDEIDRLISSSSLA